MKRLYGVMALFVLIGFTTSANAAKCRVNGGVWAEIPLELPLQVPVTVTLSADRTRITLEGARLECGYSGNWQSPTNFKDFWTSGSATGSPWIPGPKFANEGAGLRINGTHRNIPIPYGILVATLPDDLRGYPIDVTPYILVRNNPSNPIDVRVGDLLGVLRLTQTNNYNSDSRRLSVTYTI